MQHLYRLLVINALKRMSRGALEFILPTGEQLTFGGQGRDIQARIVIRSNAFFRRCVLFGPIGFAESYILGEWDTPDLVSVVAWFIINAEDGGALKTEKRRPTPTLNLLNAWNRFLHDQRPNSPRKSRENIQAHYDLSNEFFRLWLDRTMTYSCAYFSPPDLPLEEAQEKKYEILCRKLHLKPSDSVLEIGCGWGGFSIHAAKQYGCKVTAVTISEQQHQEASERVQREGLEDHVTILMEDYRHVTGRFDKIVSIEMLEAVGDRYIDAYFAQCERLLAPQGLLGLQFIICPDRQYRILRDGVDFIQKHIFPGSLLPSLGRVTEATQRTGHLNLIDLEDLGLHYARTLRAWMARFDKQKDAVAALGFDEAFVRKWRYYLAYCEAAFGTRHIRVVQAIYSRPDNLGISSPVYDILNPPTAEELAP